MTTQHQDAQDDQLATAAAQAQAEADAAAQAEADADSQIAGVAKTVQESLDAFRAPLGDLVTQAGEEGRHPVGVALALSLASASVMASMGAASGLPRQVMAAMAEGLARECVDAALLTYDVIVKAKQMGKSNEEIVQELQKLQQPATV